MDSFAPELPQIRLWAGCHCVDTGGTNYKDLPQLVNNTGELATWI